MIDDRPSIGAGARDILRDCCTARYRTNMTRRKRNVDRYMRVIRKYVAAHSPSAFGGKKNRRRISG